MKLEIHPDVRRAQALPAAFYLDESVYHRSLERVFARSWQWIGPLDDVAEPGALAPRVLLPGSLDEPLLLARDGTGTLRCLSNVCTHRGNLLVDAACQGAEQIRCRYHSRRFALDGRMLFMPGFEHAPDFPGPADDLPQVDFGVFGGHGFVSLAPPAAPLAQVFADIAARLPWYDWAALRPAPQRDRHFDVAAHWALYVENYLESLHIPFVHPGLARTLDPDGYRHELFPHVNLQFALARAGEAAFDLPPSSPDHGQRVAAYYWWVFPNLMLNVYPWGLSLNLVMPAGPGRCRVLFRAYVGDAARLDQGAGGALDEVEQQDEAVVEAVQRGLRSRLYRPGRYAPEREAGVHHFHRLLAQAMAD